MEKKADEIIFTPGFIVKNDKEYYLTEYGNEYEVWQCKPQFDLSNQYCGRLKVVCRTAPPEHVTDTEQAFWLCKCQCGNYCVVRRKNLINETTKSCGCYYNDTRLRAESIYYKEFAPQKHLFDKYGISLQNNNEENENDRSTE